MIPFIKWFIFPSLLMCFTSSHCRGQAKCQKELSKAEWIFDNKLLPANDSLYYLDDPAPHFRRDFALPKVEIKKALLRITAAGYYRASLNGQQIGESSLEPSWTDFSKRIYYNEYDVTGSVKEGDNCLGVILGNGFYNPLPLNMWGHLNLRKHLTLGRPTFIARLLITFTDGQTQEILTDSGWKYNYGAIRHNSVYIGVRYDAGHELPAWDQAGYDDRLWQHAVVQEELNGKLQKSFSPGIRNTDKLTPVSITTDTSGAFIVDMGENFTGVYAIKFKGEPGDTVRLRFGERIYPDGTLNPMTSVCGQIKKKGHGGPGAPDVAWQTDSYIFGKSRDVVFTPDFTFHTFRYMEISGLKYRPELADIRGLAFNTAVEQTNEFECSAELLNRIQRMAVRTFKNNLLSVQSDCPARERFGYGGDLNATADAYICNFDMHAFYRKTVYDWIDAINDSCFIDTAPFVGLAYCGLAWESAFLITQYKLWLYYNDTALVKEMYSADLQWMDKVKRLHPDAIVDKGLGDHEALAPTPVQVIGSLHYLECSRIMTAFSRLMGDKKNEKKFTKLTKGLTAKIKKRFWQTNSHLPCNKQTLFAGLLYLDVLTNQDKVSAQDSLRIALAQGPDGHFTTGIFGTKWILSTAPVNQVFNIVNSRQYPGWGYMIDRGATTIWETWKESEDVYSNCHPMFGSVSEWFYSCLAGIRPDAENPGFKKFFLRPQLPSGLNYVHCTYQCPYGSIHCRWEKTGNAVQYRLSIPHGTRARFEITVPENSRVSIENPQQPYFSIKVHGHAFQKELMAGEYTVIVD